MQNLGRQTKSIMVFSEVAYWQNTYNEPIDIDSACFSTVMISDASLVYLSFRIFPLTATTCLAIANCKKTKFIMSIFDLVCHLQ